MRRTYVDACVLIAAARGTGRLAQEALRLISDVESREFVCSDYIKLEVVPKPTYFGRDPEVEFYETFFSTVSTWLPASSEHFPKAFEEACLSGLSAMDAIHVVVAAGNGCDEIVTIERFKSALNRTKLIRIHSLGETSP